MRAFVIACCLAFAGALPMGKEDGLDKFVSTFRDCIEGDAMLCLKVCAVNCEVNSVVPMDFSQDFISAVTVGFAVTHFLTWVRIPSNHLV